MWATIIIAESLTRIMGSTTGNVYSTIVAVVSCSITLWILVGEGAEFPTVGGQDLPPALLPAGAGAGSPENAMCMYTVKWCVSGALWSLKVIQGH